ncbi:hypothetical protein J5N97_001325 [Dioscorea zingiberensis]|uniref:Uncharacterized protein n=1 Tax=Dioscorea zingiberensis TaxID=325984 RepID=A0A9D5BVA1_9LILI|nr:hypothetical protein J5N97_001325 [Dioscorea zingiberensis]
MMENKEKEEDKFFLMNMNNFGGEDDEDKEDKFPTNLGKVLREKDGQERSQADNFAGHFRDEGSSKEVHKQSIREVKKLVVWKERSKAFKGKQTEL